MNADPRTVEGFGAEWSAFDQREVSESELRDLFEQYFGIFPKGELHPEAVGFDMGCGSGRWARFVAPQVGTLHCIDASAQALEVAKRNLSEFDNCAFHLASVDRIPLPVGTMDFGYCLGVLHHVPDTQEGIRSCASLLKPGAPFLLYLYYDFENRSRAFRGLWKVSDGIRRLIARAPFTVRRVVTAIIATLVYLPLARLGRNLEKRGKDIGALPLSYYRNRSFYTMRTDALDRFGTRLEKRFSKADVGTMLRAAGFEEIEFSERPPYWCALARLRR